MIHDLTQALTALLFPGNMVPLPGARETCSAFFRYPYLTPPTRPFRQLGRMRGQRGGGECVCDWSDKRDGTGAVYIEYHWTRQKLEQEEEDAEVDTFHAPTEEDEHPLFVLFICRVPRSLTSFSPSESAWQCMLTMICDQAPGHTPLTEDVQSGRRRSNSEGNGDDGLEMGARTTIECWSSSSAAHTFPHFRSIIMYCLCLLLRTTDPNAFSLLLCFRSNCSHIRLSEKTVNCLQTRRFRRHVSLHVPSACACLSLQFLRTT